MAIKKSCNQVSLIAVHVARFAASHKISQQRLSDFRIGIGSECLPHHGWRDCHIQQMQPAIHTGQRSRKFALGMAQRVLVKTARYGDIPAERVPDELLIKALDRRQNG